MINLDSVSDQYKIWYNQYKQLIHYYKIWYDRYDFKSVINIKYNIINISNVSQWHEI